MYLNPFYTAALKHVSGSNCVSISTRVENYTPRPTHYCTNTPARKTGSNKHVKSLLPLQPALKTLSQLWRTYSPRETSTHADRDRWAPCRPAPSSLHSCGGGARMAISTSRGLLKMAHNECVILNVRFLHFRDVM